MENSWGKVVPTPTCILQPFCRTIPSYISVGISQCSCLAQRGVRHFYTHTWLSACNVLISPLQFLLEHHSAERMAINVTDINQGGRGRWAQEKNDFQFRHILMTHLHVCVSLCGLKSISSLAAELWSIVSVMFVNWVLKALRLSHS